jgi:hypothetical protein
MAQHVGGLLPRTIIGGWGCLLRCGVRGEMFTGKGS